MKISVLVAFALVLLGGCANLAPPPPVAAPAPPLPQSAPSPLVSQPLSALPPVPQQNQPKQVAVFFATDRQKLVNPTSYETYYGTGVNTAALQYGEAIVTIPPDHVQGRLERPFKLFGIQFRQENGKLDVVIYKMLDVDRVNFLNDLKQASVQEGKQVFVFVHGFNTSFAEGLRQTAQLKNDLEFVGPAVLYSWPSDGNVAAFTADVNLSLSTVQHLEEFLREVAAIPSIKGIHVLAHSLGSRPLLFALYDLRNETQVTNKIKNVILAAPEIPQVTYSQIANALRNPSLYKTTLYVSNRDTVLKIAEALDQWPSRELISRLGDIRNGIYISPSLQTIDASAVGTDFLGHHYFANTIVPDMRALIAGQTPDQRGLVKRPSAAGPYWVVPAPR